MYGESPKFQLSPISGTTIPTCDPFDGYAQPKVVVECGHKRRCLSRIPDGVVAVVIAVVLVVVAVVVVVVTEVVDVEVVVVAITAI